MSSLSCFRFGSQPAAELRILIGEKNAELERLRQENEKLADQIARNDNIRAEKVQSSFIERQASEYYRLTTQKHVEQVFVTYARDLKGTISLDHFKAALRDLPLFSENDHDRMFKEADINKDSKLDFEEFSRAVSLPSKLEQYLSTLPLAKLLAFCLKSADESIVESSDPVRAVSKLSPDALEMGAAIFHAGLKRLLDDLKSKLRECYDELERKAVQGTNAKFQTFSMSCGTLEDFANGMSDRVGEPVLSSTPMVVDV